MYVLKDCHRWHSSLRTKVPQCTHALPLWLCRHAPSPCHTPRPATLRVTRGRIIRPAVVARSQLDLHWPDGYRQALIRLLYDGALQCHLRRPRREFAGWRGRQVSTGTLRDAFGDQVDQADEKS